ncbi:c-type cytochrome [Sedimenticola selenatireducens]|uniref:Cytochrome c4 n=1 Tax=Sedimenticola selenatireducens TaxID=191960 RepID=A0A558DVR0_9GAMM|nr:c-type cytochrome [Sedimenticola selenatireducens]TVO77827.1 cytochrome c4 [Sedimenticola selenatireducens]TVT65132.1 MAG: cytochrome c4 [Sedimenticola selenatireducens]
MKRILGIVIVALSIGQVQADALADRAKQIVNEKCYLCHGAEGESSSAIYPRLAGQHAEYIAKQLADFKAGRRKGTMNEMAADLTPEEMTALGNYFAAKPPQAHRVRDKEFEAVGAYLYHKGNSYSGVAACKSCHGEEGKGTHNLPRLAGQHKRYLVSQLQDFNKRARTNDNAVMHSIASKLTEFEIQALANYISGMN